MPAKVFVGNINFKTDARELRNLFAQAGQVIDVYLPADRATGGKTRTAVVTFANERQAAACIRGFNEYELEGRKLKLSATDPTD